MELYEYLLLDRDKRAKYLWENGELIANIKDGEKAFNLYSLSDYYVEVALSNIDNKIIDIAPFKRGVRLDKYLSSIDVESLLNN